MNDSWRLESLFPHEAMPTRNAPFHLHPPPLLWFPVITRIAGIRFLRAMRTVSCPFDWYYRFARLTGIMRKYMPGFGRHPIIYSYYDFHESHHATRNDASILFSIPNHKYDSANYDSHVSNLLIPCSNSIFLSFNDAFTANKTRMITVGCRIIWTRPCLMTHSRRMVWFRTWITMQALNT